MAAGIWAVVSTLVLICFVVRWKPGFGWAGMPPFYPALLGPFSWLVVGLSAVRSGSPVNRRRLFLRWLGVTLIGLASVGMTGARMWLKAPPEPEPVAVAEELTDLLRREKPDAVVAVLSHDRINFHTLAFMEARRGYDPRRSLREFRWRLPTGKRGDFAATLPPDVDVAGTQASLLQQIRQEADLVIVNVDPQFYRQPENAWNFFLFHHGAPVVEALLTDRRLERIYDYELRGYGLLRKYAVLRNSRRLAPRS
jgi:hypothetical protein